MLDVAPNTHRTESYKEYVKRENNSELLVGSTVVVSGLVTFKDIPTFVKARAKIILGMFFFRDGGTDASNSYYAGNFIDSKASRLSGYQGACLCVTYRETTQLLRSGKFKVGSPFLYFSDTDITAYVTADENLVLTMDAIYDLSETFNIYITSPIRGV